MKNFLIFLGATILLLGAILAYHILNPSDTTYVRQGASWVVLEQNISK